MYDAEPSKLHSYPKRPENVALCSSTDVRCAFSHMRCSVLSRRRTSYSYSWESGHGCRCLFGVRKRQLFHIGVCVQSMPFIALRMILPEDGREILEVVGMPPIPQAEFSGSLNGELRMSMKTCLRAAAVPNSAAKVVLPNLRRSLEYNIWNRKMRCCDVAAPALTT